jgi:DNA helicase HerA-like ATPase
MTVVDIDKATPRQKRAVVSFVRREVQNRVDRRIADTDNILVIADELNKFAPRSATNEFINEVKNDIVDMAERGRSIGTSLLGIEQHPSKIDKAVTENVATMAFSRLRMTEMGNRLYQTLSKEKKETVTRLEAGYMMVDFDNFQEPVLTRYPRPPCAQEPPGTFVHANDVWRSVPEARRGQAVDLILEGRNEEWENADEILSELEDLHADQQSIGDLRDSL